MNGKTKTSTLAIGRVRFILYGFILWTLWVIFYAFIFKFQVGVPWFAAFLVSAENYYVFALLSVAIWLICRKIPYGCLPVPIFLFIHFILAMLCSASWLFLTYGLWYLQAGKEIFKIVEIEKIIGWQFLFGLITYLLIAGIFYTIIYYRHYREKELREAELKLLTRDAELKALKLQINPHFLFNSLNSINALVTQNPKLARQMIARLSELLRMSLESRDRLLVPLKEELELAHTYLDIERIRFSDKMDYHEEVEPELLSAPFPAMVLQPLLENAVKHGIASSRKGGTIQLVLKRQGDRFWCKISNDVNKSNPNSKVTLLSNRTGLSNIRQRLDLLYGKNYHWEVGHRPSGKFEVILSLPWTPNEQD